MQTVESLPTYGVHYYEVKDKSGNLLWLGISHKGITQYEVTNKNNPKKVFLWKQLENLYFRDRKFSIEVFDPKKLCTSRKAFSSGNITVHVWFSSTPALTKSIWSMAIAQHQFYLDRKHNKVQPIVRTYDEISSELSDDHCKCSDSSTMSRSTSTHSLPALKINGDCLSSSCETIERLLSLKARKEALEEALHRKCEELKKLCFQEGGLTGVLPIEMPLSIGEVIPQIRKRLGSDFSLKERLSWKKKTKEEEELSKLELEYEIQFKIVAASRKLISDPATKKTVNRQHKISHKKAQAKLNEIEQKLCVYKSKVGKMKQELLNQSAVTDQSDPQQTIRGNGYLQQSTEPSICSAFHESKFSSSETSSVSPPSSVYNTPCSSSVPSSPVKLRHKNSALRKSDKNGQYSSFNSKQGYTPNAVYQTRTLYRSQQYPTLPTKLPTSYSAGAVFEYYNMPENKSRVPSSNSPYQNKFESSLEIDGSNLYSVPTQRTSKAFDTQDDILASFSNNQQDLGLMSRHNSLDRSKQQSFKKRQFVDSTNETSVPNRSSICSSISYTEHLHHQNLYQVHSVPYNQSTVSHNSQTAYAQYDGHHPHYFHHHRLFHTQQFQNHEQIQTSAESGLAPLLSPVSSTGPFSTTDASPTTGKLSQGRNFVGYEYQSCINKIPSNCVQPASNNTYHHWPQDRVSGIPFDPHNQDLHVAQSQFQNLSVNQSSPCSSNQYIRPVESSGNEPTIMKYNIPKSNTEVSIVSYGHYQPYWEETKPYETSDFYKYSTRHRNQQLVNAENSTLDASGNSHNESYKDFGLISKVCPYSQTLTHSNSDNFVPHQKFSQRIVPPEEQNWTYQSENSLADVSNGRRWTEAPANSSRKKVTLV